MRRKQSLWWIVAGLLLVVAAPAGAETTSRPPAVALGLIRDLRMTVIARRAFQHDRVLKSLNLGVKVRGGVATVWGPVPSAGVARQAMARLEAIDGIQKVRSEMQLRRPADRPALAELGIPAGAPRQIQAAKPLQRPAEVGPRQRELASLASDEQRRPGNLPELKPLPMPSAPPLIKPVAVTNRPVPVRVAVERMRTSEGRFRTIAVEVQGSMVIIKRSGSADEDVLALAQAVRRIRGVSEVILSSD